MHFLWFTLSPVECMWIGAAIGWLACGASVLIVPTIWRVRDVRSLTKEDIVKLLGECADELRARLPPEALRGIDTAVREMPDETKDAITRNLHG